MLLSTCKGNPCFLLFSFFSFPFTFEGFMNNNAVILVVIGSCSCGLLLLILL